MNKCKYLFFVNSGGIVVTIIGPLDSSVAPLNFAPNQPNPTGAFMRPSIQWFVAAILLICLPATSPAQDATTAPATQPTTAPVTITWQQAKDHIGEKVTVIGPVIGSHDFGDAAVLNIGKDFPAPDRFTVYISAENRAHVPEDLYAGKTISVTGKPKLFHKVPEIEAAASNITVVPATQPATTQP